MLAAIVAAAAASMAAQAPPKAQSLSFRPMDHPRFVPASQATFLHSADLLIGVSHGNASKAYPAAIVAQHGIAEDRMPDGPITVTW